MVLLVVFLILSVVMSIWALVIIFKRSIVGGLLTLFLGIPMLYYLVTGWGKEGEDIKKPFFLSIIFYVIAIGAGVKLAANAAGEVQRLDLSAPAARSAPRFREPAQPVTPAAQPVAAPRAPVQRPVAVRQEPRRPQAAQSNCVYKPVMTDEDMAKCR